MNEGKRNRLLDHLEKITSIENRIYPDAGGLSEPRDESDLQMRRDVRSAYEAIVAQVMKDRSWRERFSGEFVTGQLQSLAAAARASDKTHIPDLLDQFISAMEKFDTVQTVYVPLSGVALSIREVSLVGAKVVVLTEDQVSERLADVDAVCQARGLAEDDSYRSRRRSYENLLGGLRGKVCAEVRVTAEPRKAEEIAKVRVAWVVQLLRLTAFLLGQDSSRGFIGVEGERIIGAQVLFMIPSDYRGSFASTNQEGAFDRLQLSQYSLREMRRLGVFEVSRIFEAAVRTPFEDAILRSTHWIAAAVDQASLDGRFLNLMIAIETFLTPDSDERIAGGISDATAVLTEDTLTGRMRVRDDLRQLYGRRSKISHGRDVGIDPDEYGRLCEIVRNLYTALVARRAEFRDREQLLRHVDAMQLTPSPRGGLLPPLQAALRLGLSVDKIDERRRQGRLLGVPVDETNFVYPAWQFENPDVTAGIGEVLPMIADLEIWRQLQFLLTAKPDLGGQSPLDMFRRGQVEQVARALRAKLDPEQLM